MNLIFDELKPHLPELMIDVFGNYVVQKALRRGSAKHVDSIVSAMENKILELSLSTYGCRVVQTALDVIPDAAKRRLASELKVHVKRSVRSSTTHFHIDHHIISIITKHTKNKQVRDQNGNHVVQKIVENISSPTFVVGT